MLPIFHLTIERWKKNTEYGVWVSNLGQIKLIKNKQILNQRICQGGYCVVFTEKGVMYTHRLVAYTWLGGKRNANYNVDHIDSNKRNNSVKNLRWVPKQINTAYAAFTLYDNPVEPVCIEEEEDIIRSLADVTTTIETRIELLKRMIEEKKIKILYDGTSICSYEELLQVKNKINKNLEEKSFISKILAVANYPVKYCGRVWRIKAYE